LIRPNLILDSKSAEQFPFGDDIENRLSSDVQAVVNF
jgi:hypothetical protein